MKNLLKTLGIIAITAIIAFSMAGCDGGGGGSDGGGNGGSGGGIDDGTFTVTFNPNGGSTVPAITGIESGVTINAPTVPTKRNYDCIFVGWYKDVGLNNEWNFASDKVTANITLYAKWRDYEIGEEGPGGGKIFYKDKIGFIVKYLLLPYNYNSSYIAYYLEAAPTNASGSTVKWGDKGTNVEGITKFTSIYDDIVSVINSNINSNSDEISKIIGNGRKDTQLIAAHMESKLIANTAAQVCIDYRGPNNLDDWFLPSCAELYLYYKSTVTQKPTGQLWSSSEYSNLISWYVDFGNGNAGYMDKDGLDSYLKNVRAIRAF